MRKLLFIRAIACSVAVLPFFACNGGNQSDAVKEYVAVGYGDAVVREAPAADAASVADAKYGEIFAVTEAVDNFVKARNIVTGVEGYIDTMQINRASYPVIAPELFDTPQSETPLLYIETNENGESTSGWAFWKEGDKVKGFKSVTLAYNDGRVNTLESYYLGEAKDGYLIFTEQVDYEGEPMETLETPIIVWEDIASRAGVFEGGFCFTPGGQLFVGDDEEWE